MSSAIGVQIACRRTLVQLARLRPSSWSRALEAAFALARERSAQGSAVEENRAALLALGVVLGHPRLARAVGEKDQAPVGIRATNLEGNLLAGAIDLISLEGKGAAVGKVQPYRDSALTATDFTLQIVSRSGARFQSDGQEHHEHEPGHHLSGSSKFRFVA